MTILWVEVSCLEQQSVDLLYADPGIGVDDRGHIDPVGPGLGDEGIRLKLVERVLALLGESLNLFGRRRGGQCLIGGIELLV